MRKTKIIKVVCSMALLTFFLSGAVYSECIKGDCQDGTGTLVFPGGSKYTGGWKNGKMNGKGEFIFSSGARYVGEWHDDELVSYSSQDSLQKNGAVFATTDPGRATEKSNIEKRFLDKDFDPSTDLPPAASGPAEK